MIKQSYLFSFAVMLVIMLANLSVPSHAASLGDGNQIPHIGDAGRADYLKFTSAPLPRAFAIAPGGVWAWVSGGDTKELTELDALNSCRQYTEQTCQLYAVDDQVVFDETQWTSSWRLHLDGNAVANAPVGIGRAQRFPDLALTSPNNRPIMLSDLRGKPVFLHFWGSWCPPCQTEFADLQKLYNAIKNDDAISFVLVQGRESIEKSQRWMEKRKFVMPLYDSGHKGRGDKSFRLANGTLLADRRLALAYPTTYILDANGLVVFHQSGAGEQWAQYENLIRHLTDSGIQ
ncbi:MAG: TlpA family protein disulfide reductase [Rhodospirillaceae bacterium]|nr:TlpA family protein disulfide reductase [Rhodospirillaceae bacterium]